MHLNDCFSIINSNKEAPSIIWKMPYVLKPLFHKIAVHPAALVELREVYPCVSVPGAVVIDLNLFAVVQLTDLVLRSLRYVFF